MLGSEFIIIAILLRFLAGANYLLATWHGKVKPNPVTWLFWGLAPLVAFAAQVQAGLTPTAWVSLALAMGPLFIFVVSVVSGSRWKVSIFDAMCGLCALVGIVLWQVTTDPALALTFGILADILGGIPTLRKSYSAPDSEKALPYLLSVSSMVITLLIITDWTYLTAGFPIYILIINSMLYGLIASRIGVRLKRRRPARTTKRLNARA